MLVSMLMPHASVDFFVLSFVLGGEDQVLQTVLFAQTAMRCLLTDLNYWIKHPFEFSDPIVKPEYL